MHRFGVIIPTRNRPDLLQQLVQTLNQIRPQPISVVIVDSSDSEKLLTTKIVETFKKDFINVDFHYVTTSVKSASSQRNIGLDQISLGSLDYLLFLDDDTLPSENYVSSLIDLMNSNPKAIGCSGITLPKAEPFRGWRSFYFRFFFMASNSGGRLLRSGVNIPVFRDQIGLVEVDWLFGCSMWRSSIFRFLKYSDNLPGGALAEDVIFSTRARRFGALYVNTFAILHHSQSQINRPSAYIHEARNIRNRYEIIKLSPERIQSTIAFSWFVIGTGIKLGYNVLYAKFTNRDNVREVTSGFCGYLRGVALVLSNRNPI